MGQRLADTFDDAHFDYTEADFKEDWEDIVEISEDETVVEEATEEKSGPETATSASSVMDEIAKAKQMFDAGILTEQEFSDLKAKLISKL